MRKLKYHEKKLLKKVNYLEWKEDNPRMAHVIRKYGIKDISEYHAYNLMCGQITKLANLISLLPHDDEYRILMTGRLVKKLYDVGLLAHKSGTLNECMKITVSSFCKRRLPVLLKRLNMAERIEEATNFVIHGHVLVGTNIITDPAYFVPRIMEDHVTWAANSKIRRTIQEYEDKVDDYILN